MYKRKEYPIKSYVPMRTNKDRTCICCGDTIPAGSSRMIPRHAKANHGLCFPCFRKWRDTGGDLKLMDNPGDAKKEHVIHMSNILKGNCDIIKGRKLYVAFKKAINGGKKIVIKKEEHDEMVRIGNELPKSPPTILSFNICLDKIAK